jgi:hypothetical protein
MAQLIIVDILKDDENHLEYEKECRAANISAVGTILRWFSVCHSGTVGRPGSHFTNDRCFSALSLGVEDSRKCLQARQDMNVPLYVNWVV